jgi:predicted nuclease of predicted toxin-antitoxin system
VKFLADECCDASLVQRLRGDNHDVVYAVESMRGATDADLLRRAFEEQRIVLTEGKDFGELVYRLRRPAHGVVLLRFATTQRALKISRLRSLLENQPERLVGAFVTLEPGTTRLRPLR